MKELITIKNQNGKQLVDGRELHDFLESKQEFTNWIKGRIEKYGFIENVDYTTFDNFIKREGSNLGTKRVEYILTLGMAKELSMVENNDQGKQARKYFIECEKQIRNQIPQLSKELQAIFMLDNKTQAIEARLDKNDVRFDKIENRMIIDFSQQEEIRTKVNAKVIQELGGMDAPAYKELNKKAFASFWRDYKRQLNVNSYRNTAIVKFGQALKFINNWEPNRELDLMIKGANSQRID